MKVLNNKEKRIIYFEQRQLNWCCGVDEIGDLYYVDYPPEDFDQDEESQKEVIKSGTGLFVSTFINTEECKEAYNFLCSQHTLLFQSAPYKNSSSGRLVFLCVFKWKG